MLTNRFDTCCATNRICVDMLLTLNLKTLTSKKTTLSTTDFQRSSKSDFII